MPLPLDSRRNSSGIEQEDSAALLARLRHLERLLEEFGTAQPPDGSGNLASAGARDALVSPRVPPFTEAIADRLGVETWDAADAIAARVLLDELIASLRGCRTITNAVSAQLRETHTRLKEGRKKLDREIIRRSRHATRRANTEVAADQGSTD